MDTKPKTSTRSRVTLDGNVKTVTKSKSVDAAGTKTKTRKVERFTPGYGGPSESSVTKQKTKQQFATGATRKVKSLSSNKRWEGAKKGQSEERSYTATKEKAAAPGLKNKVKSLAKPSHKTGYRSSAIDGVPTDRGKMKYDVAKSNVNYYAKKMRKKSN
jgi:hypothetical protein